LRDAEQVEQVTLQVGWLGIEGLACLAVTEERSGAVGLTIGKRLFPPCSLHVDPFVPVPWVFR
jgi:hypothetical protein